MGVAAALTANVLLMDLQSLLGTRKSIRALLIQEQSDELRLTAYTPPCLDR